MNCQTLTSKPSMLLRRSVRLLRLELARRGGVLRSHRQLLELLVVGALALIAGACTAGDTVAPELPVHTGPVVLITVDTLRADVVGALGRDRTADAPSLTPHMDQLISEAEWASAAIATSSWTVPSMASIVTGRQPWSHGNIHGERAILADEQNTLAEAFKQGGYSTTGFRSNVWLRPKFGYAQGFDAYHTLGARKRALAVLESLQAGDGSYEEAAGHGEGAAIGRPPFVWLHVLPPHAPYLRHDQYADRISDAPPFDQLPDRVTAAMLEMYLDPEVPLPADERERFWTLYRLHVAHADAIVGELLDAIRRSGAWDDTLIVLTSDHGEEFGEEEQIAHGGNLNPVLIEVPLVFKLPQSLVPSKDTNGVGRALQDERRAVSNARVYATLLEAIGQRPGPGVLPSLWDSGLDRLADDTAKPDVPTGALSELYLGNGDSRFSLVEPNGAGGLRQIHWTSRFAESEPEYYLARRAKANTPLPSGELPAALWKRQARAFSTSLPLRGSLGKPEVVVRPWSPLGFETADLADTALVRRLERVWSFWNGEEEPPAIRFPEAGATEFTDEERARLEALGYVVGG